MECKDCTEHTGIIARIVSLEKQTEHQQECLEQMKGRLNQILGAVLVSVIGVLGQVLYAMTKGG